MNHATLLPCLAVSLFAVITAGFVTHRFVEFLGDAGEKWARQYREVDDRLDRFGGELAAFKMSIAEAERRLHVIDGHYDNLCGHIDDINQELSHEFGPHADLRLQGRRADHSHLVLDRLRTAVEGRLKLVPDDPLARAMAEAFDTDDDRLGRLIVPAGDLAADIEHPATIMSDALAAQILVEYTAGPEHIPYFTLAPGPAVKCPDNLCLCQASYAVGGDYVIQTTV